jgi:hypothetical protein
MSKYERQKVEVASLQDGDTFELPDHRHAVCRVTFHKLKCDEDGREMRIIGYDILEGTLHWPVLYLPVDYPVILLLPTTTYVKLSGKAFVDSLVEQHGVER